MSRTRGPALSARAARAALTARAALVGLGLRLAVGSRGRRGRSVLAATAVGVGVLLLLVVWTVAQARLADSLVYQTEQPRLLAVIVGGVALPVVVLAATVGRLSAALRDRRLGNLRLLGLSVAGTRLVAAVETGVAALAGAVVGLLVALAVHPALPASSVLSSVDDATPTHPPGWAAYLLVAVGLPVITVAAAALPQRLDTAGAVGGSRVARVRRPSWWRVAPLTLGILLSVVMLLSSDGDDLGGPTTALLFGGILLTGLGLVIIAPVFVRLSADVLLRVSRGPVALVTARRLQAQPAGVSRIVAALMVGLFLVTGARAVVVALESTPEYRASAAALSRPQLLSGLDSSVRARGQARRALEVQGVRAAAALPVLAARCSPGALGECQVLVASCAQLVPLVPDLTGCLDGRAQWLGGPTAPSGALRGRTALRLSISRAQGAVGTGVRVRAPTATAPDLTGLTDDYGQGPADTVLVVPPTVPGVAALLARTDRVVLIHADPGFAVSDRLLAAGLTQNAPDRTEYDFVNGIRTTVWSLAALILALGLLTFAVAGIDRATARRREITGLRLLGTPVASLRRAQWLEALLPTCLGCVLAVAAGLFSGATYLHLGPGSAVPWRPSLLLAAVALAASVVVAGLTVLATGARISAGRIRVE